VSSLNKGAAKVEVRLRWDPSPLGAPPSDLDIIAATYRAAAPHGEPAYLVHFDSRSPDGTITLNRDSKNGKGLGDDEVMTLELDRLSPDYSRVLVGIAIQQGGGHLTFADIANPVVRLNEGYNKLSETDFAPVATSTAATVAEFVRDGSSAWRFRAVLRGFDADPDTFARTMGA
jgi:tellurium resistance protein TerD